jgi:hypothetical protein
MSEQRVKSKSIRRPRLRREGDRLAGVTARTKYRLIAEERGFATAHQLALEDLFGIITWLNDTIGTRETYEVVQQHADLIVETVVEHNQQIPRPRLKRWDEDEAA